MADDIDIRLTAHTEGVVTNRIVVDGRPKRASPAPDRVFRPKRGRPYKIVCISVYVDELNALDALAEKLMLSRSALVRVACEQLEKDVRARLWPPAKGVK